MFGGRQGFEAGQRGYFRPGTTAEVLGPWQVQPAWRVGFVADDPCGRCIEVLAWSFRSSEVPSFGGEFLSVVSPVEHENISIQLYGKKATAAGGILILPVLSGFGYMCIQWYIVGSGPLSPSCS